MFQVVVIFRGIFISGPENTAVYTHTHPIISKSNSQVSGKSFLTSTVDLVVTAAAFAAALAEAAMPEDGPQPVCAAPKANALVFEYAGVIQTRH